MRLSGPIRYSQNCNIDTDTTNDIEIMKYSIINYCSILFLNVVVRLKYL